MRWRFLDRGYRKGARSEPLFLSAAVGSASRGERGFDHRRLSCWPWTVSLHLTGVLETQNPKFNPRSITNKVGPCTRQTCQKRRSETPHVKKAGQNAHTHAAASVCLSFFFFPERRKNQEQSRVGVSWRQTLSHPVFFMPALPPPPWFLLQRKRGKEMLVQVPYTGELATYIHQTCGRRMQHCNEGWAAGKKD